MMTRALPSAYARREHGTVAMILALALIPVMMVFGLAFDIQRAQTAKQHVQVAADAAALAGAREYYDGSSKAAEMALAYFNQSMSTVSHGAVCDDPIITTDDATFGVTVTAKCSVETTVSGLVGRDKIDVGTTATASSRQTKLDLALMLDVSGSMDGQKLEDLKTAANNAVDILLSGAGNDTKISLAPYSTSVNLGAYSEAAVGPKAYNPKGIGSTCVTEREGKAKKTNEAPGPGKFVGYRKISKKGGKLIWCPSSEIAPLSNQADDIKKKIKALKADGWTAGQLGIAWSWYTISPEWKDFWPAKSAPRNYDTGTIKAVILMTDGSFNTTYDPGQGNSVNQSKAMCQEMRDRGIRIYSVAFQAPPGGKSVLKHCAANDDQYFEPESGEELIAVYGEIASKLSDLRLTN